MDKNQPGNQIKVSLIDDYVMKNNISKHKFCKLCKIHYSVLQKIISNQYNYSTEAIFKVAKILKINVSDMFE